MSPRRRYEGSDWHRQMMADQAADIEKCAGRMREYSPYRAAPACDHRSIVERTCDHQPPPQYVEGAAFLPNFVIRARRFECADCGVGVWPASDAIREAAPRLPRCVLPACDCLTTENIA